MVRHSPFAGPSEPPTSEDVQELRSSIESLRDHVQIVWQAIDELRDVIDQALGPDSPDIWSVEPPQGPPVGRYRPFAGYAETDIGGDDVDEANERTREFDDQHVEPPPALETSVADPDQPIARQRNIFEDQSSAVVDPSPVGNGTQAKLPPSDEAVENEVYTLDHWIRFRHEFADGKVDADRIHAEFRRMKAGRQHFIEELVRSRSADQLRLMAMQHGCFDGRRNTKLQNAEAIYLFHLGAFALGEPITYQPLQETYEDAVERIVMAITDESLAEQRDKHRKEKESREKALINPQTLLEFATFIRERDIDELSDEQFALWDQLHADRIREDRRSRKQPDAVEQFQSAEIADVELRIIEGFHDREQVPLWIVQLASRVERSTFDELKRKASQLCGWWSSFKKDAAGFQFRSRESAEKFARLTQGDVDRTQELLARKLRKMDNAADRLNAVADTLETKAAEVVAADLEKLKNTARRADMA